jgi:aspartate kinase
MCNIAAMKVFKFGGASVKDAEAIRNVADILAGYQPEFLVVVVSAMGKSTNALESISRQAFEGEPYQEMLDSLVRMHREVAILLEIPACLDPLFSELSDTLRNADRSVYDAFYDRIVPFGEALSTQLLSSYLSRREVSNTLLSASDIIRTDSRWRDARIVMDDTCQRAQASILPALRTGHVITQGFVGGCPMGTTTLGREGSDYTGAILAHCLDAEGLWIWKDVPGVLTADPKEFNHPTLLEEISYYEAIEMTFYGASVIHPKTIQPLQAKGIPLFVRSFQDPSLTGTVIRSDRTIAEMPPVTVLKKNQVLLTVRSRDFSFMAEEQLSQVYGIFSEHGTRINLMQTSALSLSVCIDNRPYKRDSLLEKLQAHYEVRLNEGLKLLTIRHYRPEDMLELSRNPGILLTQQSRHTFQVVMRDGA